ncbi:DNA adenine methylase [Mycoplasmopsis gallinacea]|uniref:site-specific DNA-methyltransferase (adenine-specific) n=1 Tax=Mycoplasmopsis gallinacea TaxID=29556 RepID=A0A6H0V2T7_9BACT|nr:DNA adenine methylase [Mycoplasmopsis gallinacea]QIW62044.1 adenine methyltransferase [Mycoplasmopsis gallinacea]
MKIENRRYIGCKTKLLNFIYDSIKEFNYSKNSIFADIFAGTGVVAHKFATEGYRTILNDTLYSNYVVYQGVFGKGKVRKKLLKEIINELNKIKGEDLEENYFSNIYGGKYFSVNDAKKIGYIREYIENKKSELSEKEYYSLISSLIYISDRIANTVGHFESFLKKEPIDKKWNLSLLENLSTKNDSELFNEDANSLVKKIKADIVYIDPPYNARQYINFYHVLENLARWEKPTEFEGKSMKFKRDELKSGYSRSTAPLLFEDLINNINSKLIVVSYNNTYKAGSTSSVNKITEEQMINILKKKGRVIIKEIPYKVFNSGKTELKGHKELLYICEVNKWDY